MNAINKIQYDYKCILPTNNSHSGYNSYNALQIILITAPVKYALI
jgi:hypothetical protein